MEQQTKPTYHGRFPGFVASSRSFIACFSNFFRSGCGNGTFRSPCHLVFLSGEQAGRAGTYRALFSPTRFNVSPFTKIKNGERKKIQSVTRTFRWFVEKTRRECKPSVDIGILRNIDFYWRIAGCRDGFLLHSCVFASCRALYQFF